jgi:hypothetical protein
VSSFQKQETNQENNSGCSCKLPPTSTPEVSSLLRLDLWANYALTKRSNFRASLRVCNEQGLEYCEETSQFLILTLHLLHANMANMQVRMLSRCLGFRSTISFSPDGAAAMEFVTVHCQLLSILTPDINLSQVNPHFKFQLYHPFCLITLQVSSQFQTYSTLLNLKPSSTMATMLASIIHEVGGPEVFKVQQWPKPVATAGRVLIRVKAFGLNRSEMYTRQ